MKLELHKYQQEAVEYLKTNKRCGLFLDMGLGKTAICLKFINDHLPKDWRILIIGPIKVIEDVWPNEINKWEYNTNMPFSIIRGTPKERWIKTLDSNRIHLINRENIDEYMKRKKHRVDLLIVDESSQFKSPRAHCTKTLIKYSKMFERVILLSGTPNPNGLKDLFSQMGILDQGEAFGKSYTKFLNEYYYPTLVVRGIAVKHELRNGSYDKIMEKVKKRCLAIRSDGLVELPPVNEIPIYIKLTDELFKQYKHFAKEKVLDLPNGVQIGATEVGSVCNKLCQFASGSVYEQAADTSKIVHKVHDLKLQRLKELVEYCQDQMLVFYQYVFDREELLQSIPNSIFLDCTENVEKFRRGEYKVAVAHPASVGYGLNLQFCHYVVWYGCTWNYEHFSQGNARVVRQGQQNRVFIYYLLTEDTIDERIYKALKCKGNVQDEVLNYLAELRW